MGSIWNPSMTYADVLQHSAKGSTWKKHKYIKKIGNTYVYAKAAAKYKKRGKEAKNKFNNLHDVARSVFTEKEIEKRIVDIRNGSPREEVHNNVVTYNNIRDRAADEWIKSEQYEKIERSYANSAKKELASIPKEMIKDGKKLYNSILSKIKSIRVNKSKK